MNYSSFAIGILALVIPLASNGQDFPDLAPLGLVNNALQYTVFERGRCDDYGLEPVFVASNGSVIVATSGMTGPFARYDGTTNSYTELHLSTPTVSMGANKTASFAMRIIGALPTNDSGLYPTVFRLRGTEGASVLQFTYDSRSASTGWHVLADNGGLTARNIGSVLSSGRWYRVTLTLAYTNGNVSALDAWINGVKATNSVVTDDGTLLVAPTDPSARFCGDVDRVGIWAGALTNQMGNFSR